MTLGGEIGRGGEIEQLVLFEGGEVDMTVFGARFPSSAARCLAAAISDQS